MAFSAAIRGAALPAVAQVGKGRRARCVAAEEYPSWAPGIPVPQYIIDSGLPGSYGCDPFGLGKDADTLQRFGEAELMNARWAMLGWAGIMAAELEPNVEGGWAEAAFTFRDGTDLSYVGYDVPFTPATIVGIQVITMAIAEAKRGMSSPEERKYPGGKFDVLGLADKLDLDDMKTKEIANGRVAMLATIGCFSQHAIGGTPISNLVDHLKDPGHANIVGNGALPFLLYGL